MAEDYDNEQKPKTALIKHRTKDDVAEPVVSEDTERKKVVVRRKVVVRKRPATPPTASPDKIGTERPQTIDDGSRVPETSAEVPREVGSSSLTPKEHGDAEAPAPRVTGRAETPVKPAADDGAPPVATTRQVRSADGSRETTTHTDSSERPARPPAPRVAGNLKARKDQLENQNRPTRQGFVGGRYVGPESGGTFRPRTAPPPSTSRQLRGGAPPPSGSRPPMGGRPGMAPRGPWRPDGPRPAGARPPGQGPSGGTTGTDEKKPSTKKFFKTKKKEYPKRDRHQEKELQIKQKKAAMLRANPVPKTVDIMEVITVSELAKKMNLKASDLIAKLMGMGMMVTINQQIDADTASILAAEYDCSVRIVSLFDETIIETAVDAEDDLVFRSPIVTVMGHVDHGKTKLLDAIRTTDVVAGEYGGITQHIGAYQVEVHDNHKITFLDTPGHEAFTLMRARGAQITDIVVLVVAANDGVMPQTIEAVNHAKAAKVPIIVAVNKIDLPEANIDRVKQQLSDYDLVPEAWGGSTQYVEISALKRLGIPDLLEAIVLQSEVLELRANRTANAEGKIIESRIDPGRGTVATVLIERGTLRVGDSFVAGVFAGKVRAMFNDRGMRVEEATPSMPIEILGFTGIPDAGDPFQVTDTERIARQVGTKRQELKKVEEARNVKKITLDNLYDSIQEGSVQELKVIIKGDVHGSVEAIQSALEKLSTPAVRLNAIHASAGAINENDIMLAAASDAIVIGFHVRPTGRAQLLADREKVEVRKYSIIYDVVEDIRTAMEGLLAPELREEQIGEVEVRDTFKVPKIGLVAGCYVTNGKVRRNAGVHIIRDGIEVFTGKISSLRRFKDDAREVDAGYECGIGVDGYLDVAVGDRFEVFEVREIAKKLSDTVVKPSAPAKGVRSHA